ncbi:hypothetical protein OC842_007765 [Tilletia horrida]|uniref:Retrotransposon gag domain-containing protein n=1 Tax=Tilletia horrida TaxID=155126 RepID=A0AAN6G341_9BASI|nr:hypothetical protein OC842_007765 [Tilletia horrida]
MAMEPSQPTSSRTGSPPPTTTGAHLAAMQDEEADFFLRPRSQPALFLPTDEPQHAAPSSRAAQRGRKQQGSTLPARPAPVTRPVLDTLVCEGQPANIKFDKDIMFYGDRPEDFFIEFEHCCKIFRVPRSNWFAHLRSRLCKSPPHDIRGFAENLPEWDAQDYEGIKTELINIFSDGNEDKYAIADLDNFVNTARAIKNTKDLNEYIVGFKTISNYLLKHERITEPLATQLFLGGLGQDILDKLATHEDRNRGPANKTFAQVEQDVRLVLKPAAFYARWNRQHANEQDRVKHPDRIRKPDLVPGSRPPHDSKTDEQMIRLSEHMAMLTTNLARMIVLATLDNKTPAADAAAPHRAPTAHASS